MEADVCYICYEPDTVEQPFCKPNPCICKGSIHIHARCLVTLRQQGGASVCGICKTEFKQGTPGYMHVDSNSLTIEFINEKMLRHVYTVNVDRLIHGPMRIYYPSGRLHSTYEYIYGEISGVMKAYYDCEKSPIKQVVRYVAGQMDCELLLYSAHGDVYKRINYKNGVLHGPLYIYGARGSAPSIQYYRDGVEVGTMSMVEVADATPTLLKVATGVLTAAIAEYDPLAGILITN